MSAPKNIGALRDMSPGDPCPRCGSTDTAYASDWSEAGDEVFWMACWASGCGWEDD